MKITYNIKEERKKKKLSLRALEEKSGVSKSMISNVENNKSHICLYNLCLIAKALKVKPEKLYNICP